MKLKKSYTIPKLCTRKGDLDKDWFVYFYYTVGDKRKLFRYKLGLNYFHTRKEREREGGYIASALLEKLKNGWSPISDKSKPNPNITIPDLFDELLAIKKSYLTPRSHKTYYDQIGLFKRYLKKTKTDHLYIYNYSPHHARKFMDYLLKTKKYKGKSYNSMLSTIKTFFNDAIAREYIDKSPFSDIKKIKEEYGKNTTYSNKEERTVLDYTYENERNLFYAIMFVKYCFLRRSELANLQVKHIIFDNKTIIIPSASAKSRIQDSVTIPLSLENYIIEMGILKLNPETYVFGKKLKPSLTKLNRVDDFTDLQRKVNKICGVKKECTFYSWKHTGAVELYQLTKDPYVVMRQCRHTDIKVTMIYLRSLGCGINEHVRNW